MPTRFRHLLWLPTLFVSGLVPLSGQTVVVRVTQEETGQPVAGALLSIFGGDGSLIRNALTSVEGRFFFQADSPGPFTIKAEMIGRKTVEESGLSFVAGSSLDVHLRLPINAISLDGIEVQAEGQCRLRPDEASEIYLVWEEARKALAVQEWTEKTELYRYQIVSYDRNLDPETHRILSEDRRVKTSVTQIPFRSLSPDELREKGFVHPMDDGGYMYYGPDAAVLLSDYFLDTHCFRLQADQQNPERIGLGFEPVRPDARPDIAGTFWLDRETAGLQVLEFRYTWAPHREVRGIAGGRVEFQTMSNGAWIVNDWWIRMPRVERAPVIAGSDGSGVRLFGVKETGAEISNVSLVGMSQRSEAESGSMEGIVWDSVRAVPLRKAQVYLSGTQFFTETDSLGRFRLDGVPEGIFTASFSHPRLDTLGVIAKGIDVEISPGEAVEVDLGVPAWPTVLASVCGEEGQRETAVLVGVIRDLNGGDPVPDAGLRIQWKGGSRELTGGVFRGQESWFETRTNQVGHYKACGIPVGQVLELRASFSDLKSETMKIQLSERDVRSVDLFLDLAPESPSSLPERALEPGRPTVVTRPSTGGRSVTGKVVDARSKLPIPNPTVLLKDSLDQVVLSVSGNGAGNFQFVSPKAGKYRLYVSSVGYASAESELTVLEDHGLTIQVDLSVQPVELSGIEARVQPTPKYGGMTLAGFRARQASGIGTFFDETEIARRKPSRVTDLAARTPGLNVLRNSFGPADVYSTRSLGGFRGNAVCLPEIWVDGLRVREGGYLPTHPASKTLFLNDIIPPEHIAGMEVYAGVSQIPTQFRGPTAMCGVVVIWSRRGGEEDQIR